MRVLISSTGDHGHVLPLVPLARALQDAGHEVLWATRAAAGVLVAEAGLATTAAGLDGPPLHALVERLRRRADELPPAGRAAFMFPSMFGDGYAPPMAADLLPLARDWRPDLLLHEQGELAAPLVGAVLGVPTAMQSFGGAVPAAFVTEAGRRLAGLWAEHGRPVPPYAGCFGGTFLDICPAAVQPVPLDHVRVRQPLRPVPYAGPEAPLPAGLDGGGDGGRGGAGPLVYLTLGTIARDPAPLRAAIDALADLPGRLLATVGPQGDPAGLGPQPAHVVVERWVAQTLVFPRCDVVVSHGGSGTFLGALAHGLPQLCLPQAADQFRNAGAGVRAVRRSPCSPARPTPRRSAPPSGGCSGSRPSGPPPAGSPRTSPRCRRPPRSSASWPASPRPGRDDRSGTAAKLSGIDV